LIGNGDPQVFVPGLKLAAMSQAITRKPKARRRQPRQKVLLNP
jgi:hypothetical protein